MVESAANFRKNGFGDEESAQLAQVAALLQNVADEEISAGTATDFLISQLKGFNIASEDTIHVVDAVNQVSNEFSLSSGDLVKNLGTVSAALSVGGNKFEEVLGLMTAGTEIMRQSNKVARSLISVQSRLNQIIDEESSTGKKLTAWYEEHNIAIYNQEGQIRSLYEILTDVNKIWKDLDKNEQAYYLNIQAGANQTASLAAILSNFNTALDATATAYNSVGSAAKENARFMESLSAQVQQLKSAWEAFSNSVIQSDFVKFFLSAGTSVLKAFNNDIGVTVTQFGLLTGVLTGGISLLGQFGTNLTAAIPALSKFSAGFTALDAYSPLVAAGIAAVTVVLIKLIGYFKEVNKYADDLNDAFEEANDTFKTTESTVKGTSNVLKAYTDRLKELEKSTNRTDAEQIEFSNIIDLLNEKIPNLNLYLDETTGKLNLQTKEIYNQIDAWEQLSLTQAYQDAVSSKQRAYAEAQVNLATEQARKKSLETEFAQKKSEYDAIYAWENFTENNAIIGSKDWFSRRKELTDLQKEITKSESTIKKLNKALEQNKEDYLNASRAADEFIVGQKRQQAEEQSRIDARNRAKAKTGELAGVDTEADKVVESPFGGKSYADWLKEQKHLLNTGKLLAEDYYANLQAMLNRYTDESIISTEERWDAEEEIFKYQQNLTKEQQQAYEKAVRDAESAAKAKAQAEKQAINDVKTEFSAWQDEQDYLLTTGQITEVEYYDNLKAKNEELFKGKEEFLSQYWTNLEKIYKWEQQQIEDQKKAKVTEFDEWLKAQDHALAMGEITEDEYYTELKKKNDEYFKDSTENLDKYWKNEESWYKWKKQQIEEIHEAAKAALDAEIEKEKQRLELKKTEAEARKTQLEAQQDEIERLADYVQTVADAEIGKIDEKITALKDEADAITAKYKEQIDALEEQNQAIDDQITKQKLLEALAKAQQTKKYVFKDGRFQYVDDVDAIASAQEQLDAFNREQALQEKTKQLEKQRDLELEQNQLAQKALEDEKKRWEEYKQGWSNITNAYTEQQNALLAQQKLGIDVEKATWDERLSNLESFKNQYINLAAQIKAAEAEIAGYDAQISAVGSAENQDATIRRMMKENSEAWHQTSDASERERLHEMNEYLNSLLSNSGTYNAASGQWSNLSYASQSQPLSSSIGSVGVMTPSVASSAVLGSSLINKGISGAKQALSQIFNMGNISLPNVSNAKQFVSELKNLALQAAYSRA